MNKLYVGNRIINCQTPDRPISNINPESNDILVYRSYYIEKQLVPILKNEDGTYTYLDGTPCIIIKPKSLKLSCESIDATTANLGDLAIGVANLRPIRKIVKKRDMEIALELIQETNELIGKKQIYITNKEYKTATEHINEVAAKAQKVITPKIRKRTRKNKRTSKPSTR